MQNNTLPRELTAEFIGTMFILLFGNGVCAMNTLFNLGGYINISFAWGLGVFLGILVSGKISGAHLNPAVTLALATTKRFEAKKVIPYILAQMLGAFVGAMIVFYFYKDKFYLVDPTLSHTAGIFTTFPAVDGFMPSFMAEFIASLILVFSILAIVDFFKNSDFLIPFAVSALIVAIGMSFGGMHGYAMNPARDFSPRLFTYLMGFKDTGINQGNLIWLHAILGPIIGGPIGAILYDFTIGQKNKV